MNDNDNILIERILCSGREIWVVR